MRQLQKETGVDPFGGCLPILVQMPVFIGLSHVPCPSNRTGMPGNTLGMSVEQSWNMSNYIFGVDEVQSFLLARALNAPPSSSAEMGRDQYVAFTVSSMSANFTRVDVMIVVILLIIIAVLATHFSARISVERTCARQEAGLVKHQEGPMGQQMDMTSKMILWLFPIMILVTDTFQHIGPLIHMVTSNVRTYSQQRYIFGKLDEEERGAIAAKKVAKRETQEKLAPKIGQESINLEKDDRRQTAQNAQQTQSDQASAANKVSSRLPDGNSGKGQQGLASKPAPGQKPVNRENRKRRKEQLK